MLRLALAAWLCLPALARAASRADWLTPEQKSRAERLISLFENDTPDIQYGYVEALGDGRGFTVGRGFTTATGDALDVVRRYLSRVPDAPLSRFLHRLAELARARSGQTSGLEGFDAAWREAAADPLFRQAQDELTDQESYIPAMEAADRVGLKTPLARVALYDAAVLHGTGDDPDGLPALLQRTGPLAGQDEAAWLEKFLRVRQEDILNARNPATREVWRNTAERRCPVLSDFLAAGRLDFGRGLRVGHGYDRALD